MSDKADFLVDLPIISPNEDEFKQSYFVDILEDRIVHATTPVNIGLYGSWGMGKSSILNLLKNRLETNKELKDKYRYLYVDAWKLSRDSFRQELLVELNYQLGVFKNEQIEDKLYNVREEEISNPIRVGKLKRIKLSFLGIWQYMALFAVLLPAGLYLTSQTGHDPMSSVYASVIIPLLLAIVERLRSVSTALIKSSKRIIPRVESSQQFEGLFNQLIAKSGSKKLVIAIDNLDRCDSEIVVDMLGTIKSFMNIKNCIYIFACDEQAIIKHLKAGKGKEYEERDAIEFLSKLFQVILRIPPYISGDLENYVDKQVSKLNIRLDPNVKDVLISALTRNPRKIKQFLNNFIVLYKIAEAKENGGIIQKGVITKNTAFLVKRVVLQDEWPNFYRELEKREDLLEQLEKYFDGESTEIDQELIKAILAKNDGLEKFLKATHIVSASNITVFLMLNQESFESTISDLDNFILKVSQNDVLYVTNVLEKLELATRKHHIQEVLNLLDNYVLNHRFPFAYNSLNVLLEIFHLIPENLKKEVIKVK